MCNEQEIIDCHYCEWAMCQDKDSECDCYVEDFGYFSHHVEDEQKEAESCLWFKFCGIFPKT